MWVSDEPVIDATLHVFSDPDGITEITSQLTVNLVSSNYPPALDLGIVKVEVVGLDPGETVYVQAETTSSSGLFVYPDTTPYIAVTTALTSSKESASGTPIANDLLTQDFFAPDGTTPASGALVVMQVPSISAYPLTAFVGQDYQTPKGTVDLNNLIDDTTHSNANLVGGETLRILEYRGLLCTDSGSGLSTTDNHQLEQFRRIPIHQESPPITELEAPASCFAPNGVAADWDCDGRIGLVDFARFLAKFDLERPDCRFNQDYDLDNDGGVSLADFARFASVFGTQE